MMNGRKVATVWGALALLVLAATACDTDRAGEATGPALLRRTEAGRATQPRAGTEAGIPQSGGGPNAVVGRDMASSPLYYRDPDGHLYEVRFSVDGAGRIVGAEHLRDGVLFASTGLETEDGSENIQVYDGGQMILNDDVLLAGGPVGASRPVPAGTMPGGMGPQRMMAYGDCGAQWAAYGAASAYLIVAGAWYSAVHTTRALATLRTAVAGFISAWAALYDCRVANG